MIALDVAFVILVMQSRQGQIRAMIAKAFIPSALSVLDRLLMRLYGVIFVRMGMVCKLTTKPASNAQITTPKAVIWMVLEIT